METIFEEGTAKIFLENIPPSTSEKWKRKKFG
jgi:hypothetical protein